MSRVGDTANQNDGGQSQGAAAGIQQTASQVGQQLRDAGSQVREQATEKYEQLRDQATEYYDQGRERAQEWEQNLESYVREKPLQAVAIAAGVGIVLGLLWKRG